jgi:hypothetical protein
MRKGKQKNEQNLSGFRGNKFEFIDAMNKGRNKTVIKHKNK